MAKRDLTFDPPVLNAAGCLGFAPDWHIPMDWSRLGAFVTNPISLAPRTPAHGPRFISYPGGFLLHTGYPNPGIAQVLRKYGRQWDTSALPVIVHLLPRNPEDLTVMSRQLENIEGLGGLEVGLAAEGSNMEVIRSFILAAGGELPVIVRLPMEHATELAPAAIQFGAMAISLAPPRGMLPASNGQILHGRLYGPAVYPQALKTVSELVTLGIPTIGVGGIYTREHIQAMLSAGALAVQLDSALWRGLGSMR